MRLGSCVSETPEIRGCHYVIVPRKHFESSAQFTAQMGEKMLLGSPCVWFICRFPSLWYLWYIFNMLSTLPFPACVAMQNLLLSFWTDALVIFEEPFLQHFFFLIPVWLRQFNRIVWVLVSLVMLMVSNDSIVAAALVLAFAMHIIFCHAGAWYNMVPHCSLYEFTTSRCITTYHIAAHTWRCIGYLRMVTYSTITLCKSHLEVENPPFVQCLSIKNGDI